MDKFLKSIKQQLQNSLTRLVWDSTTAGTG